MTKFASSKEKLGPIYWKLIQMQYCQNYQVFVAHELVFFFEHHQQLSQIRHFGIRAEMMN